MTDIIARLRKTGHIDYALLDEAADRIEELEQAARLVEEWWLEQGSAHFTGAPYAIFALRSALSDSTPTLLQEQKANGDKEGK
ncbi:hypothetical protein FBZ98_101976 [Rhizobium sp. ERR 922]|uniref:hypothetical protein n=1 Tax=unclassified Rhizobium TaxID=2613769 RepID=UPI0011A1D6B1|nr:MULTISPECIES: hypothetical protein [unclassified Rhizobium]TWB61631.1 hypothetical protein FBZ98_101976 [Rhizobium sp. ERR 922]TWC04557.1 hypothetical protein FBZ97_101976 [Rhizobium sp. ERR 942]